MFDTILNLGALCSHGQQVQSQGGHRPVGLEDADGEGPHCAKIIPRLTYLFLFNKKIMATVALCIIGSCVTLLVINKLNEEADAFNLQERMVSSFVSV